MSAGSSAQQPDPIVYTAATEEFVGPFPSWTNIKTVYGALGDGRADDTRALQRGLNDLASATGSPVLYLPAGRYRITETLRLPSAINVSIVGDDPASVTLAWDGAPGGTMLLVKGVAYSRFTRLTFDGGGAASAAVEQSWDNRGPYFDTGNEYSDNVFTGVEYGIRGGVTGHGFAETSILRSRFVRNTKAGIALGNFNALDIWIWDSIFDHCTIGITNEPGAGNFRVYDSTFRGSAYADLFMQNTGGFSARGNYSVGSKAFFVSGAPINHPAQVSLQANTIVDPTDSTAIRLANQGPGLMVDNVIRSLPGTTTAVVFWKSLFGADVVSVGNTFTVEHPSAVNGRFHSIDDRFVARPSLNPVAPRRPGPLPNLTREVFEVPPGADASRIQAVIDAAVARSGARPVVHLPYGTFDVSQTLIIPPSDVQLVGDGFRTRLRWSGTGSGPVLRLVGPTRATLRELSITGERVADGIVADNIDQPSARIHLSGLQIVAGQQTGLFVDRLVNASVELIDVGHSQAPAGASVKVVGGTATIFSGASSGNRLSYDISGGAKVLVRDIWYETREPGGFASIHGDAAFTMEGSRVAMPADQPMAAFNIENLNGRVTLLTTNLDDRISISGDGRRAEVQAIGNVREFQTSPVVTNTTMPPARVAVLNTRQRAQRQGLLSPGTEPVPDVGAMDPAFVLRMLADTRRVVSPARLTPLEAGVSDVRMFRVWVEQGRNNVTLRGR